jgi:TatD DNase family protein
MNVVYELSDNLYLNITNKCTNRCTFCIRNFSDRIGDKILWLEKEPTFKDIISELKKINLNDYKEIVFCGYGEPLLRIEIVKKVSRYVKENYPNKNIRVDTNGHANIFHGRNILPEIAPYIDSISISLNAENEYKYNLVSRPVFKDAYKYLIEFIRIAPNYINNVWISVVNIPSIDINKCEEIAHNLNVKFKIREFLRSL